MPSCTTQALIGQLPALVVRQLGRQPYQIVWQAMRTFTEERTTTTPDQLWFVEHDPVFTQGKFGNMHHLRDLGNIPLVQSDRGGQITYHGPGQQILYWLIDLQRRRIRVRQLIDSIEQSAIQALSQLAIDAHARPDAPGIYVGTHKIGSLGVRISRGCSFHGLALNVNMDLQPFSRINPCGYPGLQMAHIAKWLPTITLAAVRPVLLRQALQQLGNPRIDVISGDLLLERSDDA